MRNRIVLALTVIAIMCFSVTASFAKLYSAAPAGQGVSTIGIGGDYSSLSAAAADFSATPNTGNWTMQVLSNITETRPSCFGNTVLSTNTITLMPAASTNPVVTFDISTDNAGPSGFLIIGSNTDLSYSLFSVCNFVIDGSNNGSSSRNLTFASTTAFGEPFAPGGCFNMFIRCIGACPGFTVKNCILNVDQSSTAFYGMAIRIDSRHPASGSYVGAGAPFGTKILNNLIISTTVRGISGTAGGVGIYKTSAGGFTAGTDASDNDIVIADNVIYASNKGMHIGATSGGSIHGNNIYLVPNPTQTSPTLSAGILNSSNNSNYGGTFNIYGNTITTLATPLTATGNGVVGIETDPVGTNYNIYNNIIGGYSFINNTTALTNVVYRGIYCSQAATTTEVINVVNNSINMTSIANLTGETPANCFGIGFTSGTMIGAATTQNNIVRFAQSGGVAVNISTSATATIASLNNDYYADTAAGANVGNYSGTVYQTLANWQAGSGQDGAGQSVDPLVTSPSHWISNTDLHFYRFVATASAAPLTSATPLALVGTDIDGQTRSGSTPWKGADELYTSPYVTPISIFGRPGDTPVAIVVAGGIAPYSWSVSTSDLGSLDTLSGSSVNYSSGSTSASGTITVTDSSVPAQTATVSVVITPTSAPIVNDISMAPSDRKDIIRFRLFE